MYTYYFIYSVAPIVECVLNNSNNNSAICDWVPARQKACESEAQHQWIYVIHSYIGLLVMQGQGFTVDIK